MFPYLSSTSPLHTCPVLKQILELQGLRLTPQPIIVFIFLIKKFNITLLFFYSSFIKGGYVL